MPFAALLVLALIATAIYWPLALGDRVAPQPAVGGPAVGGPAVSHESSTPRVVSFAEASSGALQVISRDPASQQTAAATTWQVYVHVEGREQAGLQSDASLPVELLFGEGEALRCVPLRTNRVGTASWSTGSDVPRPWFAGLALPTLLAPGQSLAADTQEVRLQLPPIASVDVSVLEVDGRLSSDELRLEVRSPQAAWPMNRWRPWPVAAGRAEVLVEAAGQAVELRVVTSSGRRAEAVANAAVQVGERVRCSLCLPAVGGIEVQLQGLFGGDPQPEWSIFAHALVAAPSPGLSDATTRWQVRQVHRLPNVPHRHVFFPASATQAATKQWLLVAEDAAQPGRGYWGRLPTAGLAGAIGDAVTMQPCVMLANGRCVDGAGRGRPGYHVDLVAADLGVVLATVVSDDEGRFELHGSLLADLPLVAVLREAGEAKPAAVVLPQSDQLTLLVPR